MSRRQAGPDKSALYWTMPFPESMAQEVARYLYKLLEGVHLDEQWAVSAQARLQVLQYASIYEACLHHVLFELSRHDPRVQQLGKYTSLKPYDVPPGKFKSFEHDGRQIVAAYRADRLAYRRMKPFCDQVQRYVASQTS